MSTITVTNDTQSPIQLKMMAAPGSNKTRCTTTSATIAPQKSAQINVKSCGFGAPGSECAPRDTAVCGKVSVYNTDTQQTSSPVDVPKSSKWNVSQLLPTAKKTVDWIWWGGVGLIVLLVIVYIWLRFIKK